MKETLIFLFLMILVACQDPSSELEEKIKKRKEFKDQLKECILKDENISSNLKKKFKENNEDDIRKILFTQFSELEQSDIEIIRKCRREYYEKIRIMNRERFYRRFNHSYHPYTSVHPSKSSPPCNSTHSSAKVHPSSSAN